MEVVFVCGVTFPHCCHSPYNLPVIVIHTSIRMPLFIHVPTFSSGSLDIQPFLPYLATMIKGMNSITCLKKCYVFSIYFKDCGIVHTPVMCSKIMPKSHEFHIIVAFNQRGK